MKIKNRIKQYVMMDMFTKAQSMNYKKEVNIRLTCKHKDEYVSLSCMVTIMIKS